MENFYTSPAASDALRIFKPHQLSEVKIWPVSEITKKYVALPNENNAVILFPFMHVPM